MILASIFSALPWWVWVGGLVVLYGLFMKHQYYQSGADEIYEKRKNEYEAKFGNKSNSASNSASSGNGNSVEETTTVTTTTTTSTQRRMGDWGSNSRELMIQDSRVTYEDPISENGNLDDNSSDNQNNNNLN